MARASQTDADEREVAEKAARDMELIQAALSGDEQSFAALVARYRSKVFRLAIRFTQDQTEAQEVEQEVFLTVFQKLHSFQGNSAFSTWLYRVTVNAALMRIRARGKNETVPIEDTDLESALEDGEAGPSPDDRIITEQSLAIIEKSMEKMPEDLKTALILRDIEGFSNEEAAEILQLTTAAVKTRLHRAREYLRERLGPLYNDTVKQS